MNVQASVEGTSTLRRGERTTSFEQQVGLILTTTARRGRAVLPGRRPERSSSSVRLNMALSNEKDIQPGGADSATAAPVTDAPAQLQDATPPSFTQARA